VIGGSPHHERVMRNGGKARGHESNGGTQAIVAAYLGWTPNAFDFIRSFVFAQSHRQGIRGRQFVEMRWDPLRLEKRGELLQAH